MSASKEARMRRLERHRVATQPEGVEHWILVPPTLPEEELEAAGRAALAERGIVFRETDELIFQDFWPAKRPVYCTSKPRAPAP